MKRFSFFQPIAAMVVMLIVAVLPAKGDDYVWKVDHVRIDGVFYEFIDDEAYVSNWGSIVDEYSRPLGFVQPRYNGDVVVPDTVVYEGKAYPVVAIIHEAFFGDTIASLTLPSSIRRFELDVFTDVTIGKFKIDSWKWWCDLKTSSWDIPHRGVCNPIGVADEVYVGGELADMEHLALSEGVDSIENFYRCPQIKSIILPSTATYIGEHAFQHCTQLEHMKLNVGLKKAAYQAFYGCDAFKTIDIPDLAHWCKIGFIPNFPEQLLIDHPLIVNGEEIVDLVIPEGVKVINDRAFWGCTTLKSVTFPQSLDSIRFAFPYCKSLESIVIPDGTSYVKGFLGCSSLSSVTIGKGVKELGSETFADCISLESIVIGDNVKTLGDNVFSRCSNLNSIVIGSGVEKIGSGAFSGCESIQTVISHIVLPFDLPSSVFPASVQRNAILYVPAGTKELYTRFDGWRSFVNIVEQEDDGEGTCLLALQDAFGAMKLQVKRSEQQTIFFSAAEGWKIHSVSYNGIDVTAQLGDDGSFMTPALYADATINVVYEEITPSAIASAESDDVHVNATQGGVMVAGAKVGTPCNVYTLDGRLAARQTISSAICDDIVLPSGQVYVVQVGAKRLKVLVP